MELDLRPRFGVVDSHECFPCRRGVEIRGEVAVAGIAEPWPPYPAGLELLSELVAATVVAEKSHGRRLPE